MFLLFADIDCVAAVAELWLRTVEADLRPFNLGLASGFKKAQDRATWRALTGTATSPTSPE